jgi:mono/diheme cytochrome c family protein
MAIVRRHRRLVRSTLMIPAASLLVWLVGSSSAQEFPADVTRGKAVYERHCVSCHGISGWGDGPEARSLTVPPANFHRFSSYLKSDEQLQRTIEYGIVFSPMHSWQGQLTETEIRDVLEYIRLLSQQGR